MEDLVRGHDDDLLLAGPVEALVDHVYADLDALEGEVLWAQHRAEVAEHRLLDRRTRVPDAGPPAALQEAVAECAATARTHLDRALEAAVLQADAIVGEARWRAEDVVARAQAEAERRAVIRPSSADPDGEVPLDPPPAPADPATSWEPFGATPPPAPAGEPVAAAPAPPAVEGGPDATFDRFWAESAGAVVVPDLWRIDPQVVLAALSVAVVVVLMLVLL